MAAVSITLFGGFAARRESGESIPLKGRKSQALLAYLALSPGQTRQRSEAIALLWGDRGEQQARSSLRQSLSELRKALDEGAETGAEASITADRDSLSLNTANFDIDVVDFEALADEGSATSLEQAVALYSGELLAGAGISDSAFEDWLRSERQRLRGRVCQALSDLLDLQRAAQDFDQAISTAQTLLEQDPLRESAHRALMGLYAAKGERTLALKQYQACKDLLLKELGIASEAETDALAEDIRKGSASQPSAGAAGEKVLSAPAAAPSLAEKPAIAVLPFDNMSGDPEQDYFADGMTEDIITELSRFRDLSVIARNSTFHYKGQSPKVQEIGQELGVAYLVEGSVRKAGNRVRITAQLIDVASGNHLWAERYDRDLEDVFAVQDEVTRRVVSTVAGRIDSLGHQRATRMSPDSLQAYDLFLRAKHLIFRFTREDNAKARDLLARAIDLDPTSAQAYTSLCSAHYLDWIGHWVAESDDSIGQSIRWGKEAVAVDETNCRAHWNLGEAYIYAREFDKARFHFEKAIELNPNDVEAHCGLGFILTCLREIDQAIAAFDRARQVDPLDLNYVPWLEGFTYFTAQQYDRAIACFEKLEDPHFEVHSLLAASYAHAGKTENAKVALEKFLHQAEQEMVDYPGRSLAAWKRAWHGPTCYKFEEDADHWLDGLRLAGLEA